MCRGTGGGGVEGGGGGWGEGWEAGGRGRGGGWRLGPVLRQGVEAGARAGAGRENAQVSESVFYGVCLCSLGIIGTLE